jgi:hypothetical protein
MTAEERRWCDAIHSLENCVLCGTFGVQWAHRNEGRGMGQKSSAHMTAALCQECHHELDNAGRLDKAERRRLMERAIVLTHDALIRAGKLKLV